MAEAKRDRTKVSLAWLAHWALVYDDEDQAFVGEYLDEALTVISQLRCNEHLSAEESSGLVDLTLFLVGLRQALDPDGGTRIHLRAEPRKTTARGGRRRLSYEENLRRSEAGARAYRIYNAGGCTKSEAITRAWAELSEAGRSAGLSERIIERALDAHRRIMASPGSTRNPA